MFEIINTYEAYALTVNVFTSTIKYYNLESFTSVDVLTSKKESRFNLLQYRILNYVILNRKIEH